MDVSPEDSRDDIQAAIDTLADDGGGTLTFAVGTYDIDEALVWRPRVDLRGEGYATHLKATAATNLVESHYDETTGEGELADATIANMRLDGNREAVPDGRDPGDDYPATHSTSGLWIPFAERVTVRNLYVESCHGHGIHPDAAIDCTVTNNVVVDCLIGFHIATRMGYEYGPVRTVATNNHVIDCRLNGLDFGSGGRSCVAAHNTIARCASGGHGEEQWAGIRMRGNDHAAVGNTVLDCPRGLMLARQRSTEGGEVHWEPGRRSVAANNTVRGADAVGIEVRDVTSGTVAANAVSDAGVGVHAEDSPDTTVTGNHVVDADAGLRCVASPRTAMTGNHVRSVAGTAVAVEGSDGVTVGDTTVADADAGITVEDGADFLGHGNAVDGAGLRVGPEVEGGVVLGNRVDGLAVEGAGIEAGYNL